MIQVKNTESARVVPRAAVDAAPVHGGTYDDRSHRQEPGVGGIIVDRTGPRDHPATTTTAVGP